MSDTIRLAVLTVLGLGRLRPAPGTWGSAAAACFCLGVLWSGASPAAITIAMLAMIAVFSVACVALGRWAETHYGRSDPGEVVADEVAGQGVALLFLPWQVTGDGNLWNLAMAGTAFAAFRFFDILKPPPINQVQRAPAGWGILLDDLLAGAAALTVVQVVFRVLP
jgi:phosphatidylglycerophosphatase A